MHRYSVRKAAVLAAAVLLAVLAFAPLGGAGAAAPNAPNAASADSWLTLGQLEVGGGNLSGAEASLERAMALGKRSRKQAVVAAAAFALGTLYSGRVSFAKVEMDNAAMFGGKPSAADTAALDQKLNKAKAFFGQAVALHKALKNKEALVEDYSGLGDLYDAVKDSAHAHSMVAKAAAIQKTLPRKPAPKSRQAAADSQSEKKSGGGRLIFNDSLGLYVSGASGGDQFDALQKAVPMEKALGHQIGLATSYILLGLHYEGQAKTGESARQALEGKAEAMFDEALALNKTLGRQDAMAYVYSELILVCDRRGELDRVNAMLNDSAALYKRLGDDRSIVNVYYSLGQQSKGRGDQTRACGYWRKGALAYANDQSLAAALTLNKCADGQ